MTKSFFKNIAASREVIEAIAAFLGPIAERLTTGHDFKPTWKAQGPWRE